jgi:hypothetical protein
VSKLNHDRSIGGYFSLERNSGDGLPWIDQAIGYRSARSALAAVLQAAKPKAVWVPFFICGAVNQTLLAIEANVHRYSLGENLEIPDDVELETGDLLICVDYFGLNSASVSRAIDRFGADKVVVDASQSLFFKHRDGCSTIYSPRKFLGIPDGGLVRTARQLSARIEPVEDDSIRRCNHLLYRLAGLTETGYARFRDAEASLSGCEPQALSKLTEALLRNVNLSDIAQSRIRNYNYLRDVLNPAGIDVANLPVESVPLCCPVRCENASFIRAGLVAERIFTPVYWPDAVIPDHDQLALQMRDEMIYLPCDQRYGDVDMLSVAQAMIRLKGVS